MCSDLTFNELTFLVQIQLIKWHFLKSSKTIFRKYKYNSQKSICAFSIHFLQCFQVIQKYHPECWSQNFFLCVLAAYPCWIRIFNVSFFKTPYSSADISYFSLHAYKKYLGKNKYCGWNLIIKLLKQLQQQQQNKAKK